MTQSIGMMTARETITQTREIKPAVGATCAECICWAIAKQDCPQMAQRQCAELRQSGACLVIAGR